MARLVCSFNPTKHDLRLYGRDGDDKPHRTCAALAARLKAQGRSLKFAMNGHIYQADLRPVGLYIENGRELTRANTATRSGAPSQIPTSIRNRMACSLSAMAKRAFLRRNAFISPVVQDYP